SEFELFSSVSLSSARSLKHPPTRRSARRDQAGADARPILAGDQHHAWSVSLPGGKSSRIHRSIPCNSRYGGTILDRAHLFGEILREGTHVQRSSRGVRKGLGVFGRQLGGAIFGGLYPRSFGRDSKGGSQDSPNAGAGENSLRTPLQSGLGV